MNKEDLKALVAQMLAELQPSAVPTSADAGSEMSVQDITKIDLRKQYLVEHPHDAQAFMALKRKTPARLGSGRAGTRYKTLTMLRFRADHAAAQDSAFSLVHEDYAKTHDMIPVKTECKDKDEYLTRPDLGRRFDEVYSKVISESCKGHRVLIVVGDGLSSAAIEANAADCVAAIEQGLTARGIDFGKRLFVQFCRVGAGDHIGDLTGCELVCVLVGERPGLVTSESMSAYITYKPHRGIAESRRTVISNIHAQGIAAVEAGAHIASLIEKMLLKKASGIDFLREEGA